MPAIFLRTPLTDEELTGLSQTFTALDTRQRNSVNFAQLLDFLSRTGLPGDTLLQIWCLVDPEALQQLDFKQFAALSRAIATKQAFPQRSIDTSLFDSPTPQVLLADEPNTSITTNPAAYVAARSGGSVPMNQEQSVGSASGSRVEIPLLTPADRSKFSQLFERATKGSQDVLSGAEAKQIFVKAKLPNKTLGAIWFLCDRGTKGSLDKEEFVMAMHLIDMCLSKHPSMEPMPSKLSQGLWDSVDLDSVKQPPPPPPQGNTPVPVSQGTPPAAAASKRNSTLGSAPKPPPHRVPTMNRNVTPSVNPNVTADIFAPFIGPQDDWTVPGQLKQQFDAKFDSLNKNGEEALGPNILVPFLMKSNLDRENLADVWELSDINKRSSLTKDEFAIAMFLVKKVKAKSTLPQDIPDALLKSIEAPVNAPATPAAQPQALQTTPSIRSVSTMPSVQSPQVLASPQAPVSHIQSPQVPAPRMPSVSKDREQVNLQQQQQQEEVARRQAENQKQIEETQANIAELNKSVEGAEKDLSESYRLEVTNEQELAALKEKEAELSNKFAAVKLSLDESTKKVSDLTTQIDETKKHNEQLHEDLTTAEANYHANEAKIDDLSATLEESVADNEQIKAEITNLQSMSAEMTSKLSVKQDEVRDAMNSVDGTSKSLELEKITVDNIQKEIDQLDEKVNMYITKKGELDNYEKIVKGQHEKLEKKYKELEKHSEKIKHLQTLIGEKEAAYKEKLKSLDSVATAEPVSKSVQPAAVDETANLANKIDQIELSVPETAPPAAVPPAVSVPVPSAPVPTTPAPAIPPTSAPLMQKTDTEDKETDSEIFEDTVDQMGPPPEDVPEAVGSPLAEDHDSEYIVVPPADSEQPFGTIESRDSSDDDNDLM